MSTCKLLKIYLWKCAQFSKERKVLPQFKKLRRAKVSNKRMGQRLNRRKTKIKKRNSRRQIVIRLVIMLLSFFRRRTSSMMKSMLRTT